MIKLLVFCFSTPRPPLQVVRVSDFWKAVTAYELSAPRGVGLSYVSAWQDIDVNLALVSVGVHVATTLF